MLLRFASLGSGSAGNATVVAYGEEAETKAILVDCGFSAKETEKRLLRIGLTASSLEAILVTHEHGDHVKGVDVLARRYDIPVYMSQGTCLAGAFEGLHNLRYVRAEIDFPVGDLVVTPVTVAHDAREPLQYVIRCRDKRLGILTDLGSITPNVVSAYSGCDALFVEANHDLQMLAQGPYPVSLQRRVGGAWGHLNNEQCRALLEALDTRSLKHLVVGHISLKNNSLDRVRACLEPITRDLNQAYFACQNNGFDWLSV